MASKNNGNVAQPMAADSEAKEVSEQRYSLENLQRHCRELFGVPTVTFAGATAGIEQREYTVGEIKSIIDEWCRKVVK